MATHIKWANIRHLQRPEGARLAAAPRSPVGAVGGSVPATVRFEGYGPGGAAVLLDCLTPEPELTRDEIRRAFAAHGGHLGAAGSVSYLFNHVGLMTYPSGTDEEGLIRAALEAGAEDVVANADGSLEVLADPLEFETVRAILVERGFRPAAGELTERASLSTRLAGEPARQMVHLLDELQSLDGVRSVYSNVEISDEVLAGV